MSDEGVVVEFRLGVELGPGEDQGDEAPWLAALAQELAELDAATVGQVSEAAPEDAKGFALGHVVAGVPATAVKALVQLVRMWVVRTGRTVEASIDGDTIKITGASEHAQNQVIEAWLARHPAGS
jgi:hypothetical protein